MFGEITSRKIYLIQIYKHFVYLFELILYVPSKIFQLNRDGFPWFEQVLS